MVENTMLFGAFKVRKQENSLLAPAVHVFIVISQKISVSFRLKDDTRSSNQRPLI
jgi:hypothetical protein